MNTRIEEVHDRLAAFYPVYTAQGSATRIICADTGGGTEHSGYDLRQVDIVARALARCYALDRRAQAKLLGERYGWKMILHFYLPGSRVFIPFKTCQKRTKRDAAYGWVNLDCIQRLESGYPPSVVLKSGTVLPLHSKIETARNAYYLGQEIKEGLLASNGQDVAGALHILRGLFQNSLPAPVARKSPRHVYRLTRRK